MSGQTVEEFFTATASRNCGGALLKEGDKKESGVSQAATKTYLR
jgi:hypothetical protein